ncbi:fluoride efflux transporter FluC [Frigoribacterium sp. 2-23]|uniref:fluoride efflux transporter FluC n=1 Tax=Frigoribacterium sp. 2-23 TaxID=3415006 RepID=UPI003C6F0EB5
MGRRVVRRRGRFAISSDELDPGGARPVHLTPSLIALVALGGAVGTSLRLAVSLLVPARGPFDVGIFGVNVVGAFALGLLLEHLALGGSDVGRRRQLRLLVGTGVLGGFTTYSTLATSTATLLGGDHLLWALLYGLITVVTGTIASYAGIALARRLRRPSRERPGAAS